MTDTAVVEEKDALDDLLGTDTDEKESTKSKPKKTGKSETQKAHKKEKTVEEIVVAVGYEVVELAVDRKSVV